ncbi:MAG: glycosyltransferase [Pirellula sp.]|jgi:GT2 family glycosyltransferase
MISVVLPTHNPDPERFSQTLSGLLKQSIAKEDWELVVVDNRSETPISVESLENQVKKRVNLICQPRLGLSFARLAGIEAAKNDTIVFCDDDNILHEDFLRNAVKLTSKNPNVGVAGGKSIPLFLSNPPSWYKTGLAPLGCQDFGEDDYVFTSGQFNRDKRYPDRAPIGAGMVFRKKAMESWKLNVGRSQITDRKGSQLSSAGDCDMVLHALESGYDCAYWPQLELKHLIPSSRLAEKYLAAISRAAFRDFVIVLDMHRICPWSRISRFSFCLRVLKSWLQCKAWRGPVERIRWQSSVGQFEGRVALVMKERD